MKRRRYPIWVAVALIAFAGWFFVRPQVQSARSAGHAASPTTERRRVDLSADTRREALVSGLRPKPAAPLPDSPPSSLRGTDVDGALPVDADGHLIVAPSVRNFFDYFFIASGERTVAMIRSAIRAEIETRLKAPAKQEALQLLERYLDYRQRGRELAEGQDIAGDLDARLEEVRELRRSSFGDAVADALFAEEEARDYIALAERQVAGDPTLSEAERDRLLGALEAHLPERERAARTAATGPLRLLREEAERRERGASPEEIRALREEHFGPEAAHRLAELDRRRAEWKQRLRDYRHQREAIEADESLDEESRQSSIAALLAEQFTESERLRVRALDRIHTQR